MAERPPIYTRFVIRQLLPAPGWQGVYCGEDGAHFLMPIYALALAYRHDYHAQTRQRIQRDFRDDDPEESWDILGLEFSLDCGFAICDESANFCGLLPPDMSLETFEEEALCRHRSVPAPTPETP